MGKLDRRESRVDEPPGAFRLLGLLSLLIFCGCSHRTGTVAATAPAPAPTVADPEAQMYSAMRQAKYQIDGAVDNLGDAMDEAKAFAPTAGGDAKQALLNVAAFLNSAGDSLSDAEDVPDTLAEFKKDFDDQDSNRLQTIKLAIDALKNVEAASDVLDDLSQNAPTQAKHTLEEITGNVDDASNGLETAITDLGGKVPSDDDDAAAPESSPTSGKPGKGGSGR